MRVGAGREADTARPWSGWFLFAALALGAAAAYLCYALVAAFSSDGRTSIEAIVISDAAASDDATLTTEAESRAEAAAEDEPHPTPADSEPLSGGLRPGVFDAELLRIIEEAAGEDAEHVAVAAKRVSDGRYASLHGDFQFYAASTFKLAVLYEAARRLTSGDIELDDTVVISEEDALEDLGTSGYLEFEEDGSITIGHLLHAMITFSDNSSAVALMHEFGSRNIDDTLRGLGIETMSVNTVELWTTAEDLARLMEAIYVGEGVSERERSYMRELLLGQTIRNGIPAAIGADRDGSLLVGNKTGTWDAAQHDVAFIEAQSGAYVLSILTDGSFEGWQALQRVAARVHTAMMKTP